MESLAVDTIALAALEPGPRAATEIVRVTGLPRRKLFPALRRLERQGLVVGRPRLGHRRYRLTGPGVEALLARRLELRAAASG